MKKVGIITFHFVENLGASLQCVALYKTLEKLGYDVNVVNYQPKYHTDKYKAYYSPIVTYKKTDNIGFIIKNTIKRILLNYKFPEKFLKKRNFLKFLSKNVIQSKKAMTIEELHNLDIEYDAFVAGSDQIWNSEHTDGVLDEAYFLTFVSKDKYSYAASAGRILSSQEENQCKEYLKSFKKISVREISLQNQLNKLGFNNVCTVLDPALLLKKEEWNKILEKELTFKQKFILVYALEKSEELNESISIVSKSMSIPIIDISPRKFLNANKILNTYRNCHPKQFLSLIKNAEYIITNSFHGTVFSIIYEKQFISIPHSKTPDRVVDLLKYIGLETRTNKDMYADIIDYNCVSQTMEMYFEKSLDFLKKI